MPRQDHDRLMGMMNMARGANGDLAGETQHLQAENEALRGHLDDAMDLLLAIVEDEGVWADDAQDCLNRIKASR